MELTTGNRRLIAPLRDVGLLENCEAGHPGCAVVHDYFDYQRSRGGVNVRREAASAAGRRVAAARWRTGRRSRRA